MAKGLVSAYNYIQNVNGSWTGQKNEYPPIYESSDYTLTINASGTSSSNISTNLSGKQLLGLEVYIPDLGNNASQCKIQLLRSWKPDGSNNFVVFDSGNRDDAGENSPGYYNFILNRALIDGDLLKATANGAINVSESKNIKTRLVYA